MSSPNLFNSFVNRHLLLSFFSIKLVLYVDDAVIYFSYKDIFTIQNTFKLQLRWAGAPNFGVFNLTTITQVITFKKNIKLGNLQSIQPPHSYLRLVTVLPSRTLS